MSFIKRFEVVRVLERRRKVSTYLSPHLSFLEKRVRHHMPRSLNDFQVLGVGEACIARLHSFILLTRACIKPSRAEKPNHI
jgi:hypothetical protein